MKPHENTKIWISHFLCSCIGIKDRKRLYLQFEIVQVHSGFYLYIKKKLSWAVRSLSRLTLSSDVHLSRCHCFYMVNDRHEKWCERNPALNLYEGWSFFPHQSPQCNKLLCSSVHFKGPHIFLLQLKGFTKQTDWWPTRKVVLPCDTKTAVLCAWQLWIICASAALAMNVSC